MNENRERQHVHDALHRTLAPVQGDPQMEARLLQQLQEAPHHTRRTFRPAKLLLVPALLILPPVLGLMGIQCAQPVADAFAFVLAWLVVRGVLKKMKAMPDKV